MYVNNIKSDVQCTCMKPCVNVKVKRCSIFYVYVKQTHIVLSTDVHGPRRNRNSNVSVFGVVLLLTTDGESACFLVCGLSIANGMVSKGPKKGKIHLSCKTYSEIVGGVVFTVICFSTEQVVERDNFNDVRTSSRATVKIILPF